jgi:hypothetical protein
MKAIMLVTLGICIVLGFIFFPKETITITEIQPIKLPGVVIP